MRIVTVHGHCIILHCILSPASGDNAQPHDSCQVVNQSTHRLAAISYIKKRMIYIGVETSNTCLVDPFHGHGRNSAHIKVIYNY